MAIKHVVYVRKPHIQSLAALIKLKRDYQEQSVKEWLDFRLKYLTKFRLIHGDLFCYKCGKTGLLEEVEDNNLQNQILATVEHIIPISIGGDKYDESNLTVSCYKCNQRDDNKIKSSKLKRK